MAKQERPFLVLALIALLAGCDGGSTSYRSGPPGGAGATPTPTAVGATPTPTAVGARPTPTAVGATPTPTAVGATPTPTAVGVTPTPTAIGATPTPTPIGATPTPNPNFVNLGSATAFAILSSNAVTSTGITTINGDLGIYPGTSLTVGVPPIVVNGTEHIGDPVAHQAELDVQAAYASALGKAGTPVTVSGDLARSAPYPQGLYRSQSTLMISPNGVVTLDGGGDANSVFIFELGSALTTFTGSQVILQNGASAGNVFWIVGSDATLGVASRFSGSLLVTGAASLQTGAILNGRALAQGAAVSLDSNTVTKP